MISYREFKEEDWKTICQIHEIGEGAWTIALDRNYKAIKLDENKSFREVKRFQSERNDYPCMCLRLEKNN